jgi:hypothetical protein
MSKREKIREAKQRKMLSQEQIRDLAEKMGVSYNEAHQRMIKKYFRS